MRTFEYDIISRHHMPMTVAELDDVGKQGWELCGITGTAPWLAYVFKKEIINNKPKRSKSSNSS